MRTRSDGTREIILMCSGSTLLRRLGRGHDSRWRVRDHAPEVVSWFAVGADDVTRNIRVLKASTYSVALVKRAHRKRTSQPDGRETSLVRMYVRSTSKAGPELGLSKRKV